MAGANRLEGHRSGDSVWIDMIYVTPGERGKGEGRRLYKDFEAALPPDITLVRVFAADTEGEGNSDDFWLALGFAYRYEAEVTSDLSYEAAHTLIKGVNGHPTPASVRV